MADCSIDFICTDPPYALTGKSGKGGFMGKEWDSCIPGVEFWAEMLRICKPGSMLAAFGGTRTFHRLTCAIEDAGWEIKDCCMFLHGQGFPKAMNFGKKLGGKFEGYSSCGLKPAWEPIILAMKPLDGTYAQNAEKWGLGGINIGASKIGTESITTQLRDRAAWHGNKRGNGGYEKPIGISEARSGRWPANLLLSEQAAEMLDQMTGNLGKSQGGKSGNEKAYGKWGQLNYYGNLKPGFGDSGGASRFFYTAKASSSERNAGLDGMELKNSEIKLGLKIDNNISTGIRTVNMRCNHHPTVKPLSLMRYIIKLLAPPGNPILLDPFAGSGSTIIAAKQLGIKAIGIELSEEYCEIARKRLEHWKEFDPELAL